METPDTQRIAKALERIADALERIQPPKPPKRTPRHAGEYERRLRAITFPEDHEVTMDEIVAALGMPDASPGVRQSIGWALNRMGVQQRATASKRFYRFVTKVVTDCGAVVTA